MPDTRPPRKSLQILAWSVTETRMRAGGSSVVGALRSTGLAVLHLIEQFIELSRCFL